MYIPARRGGPWTMPLTPFLLIYVCMYVSIGKKDGCGGDAGCSWDGESRLSEDWVERRCFSCSGRWWAEEICIAVSGRQRPCSVIADPYVTPGSFRRSPFRKHRYLHSRPSLTPSITKRCCCRAAKKASGCRGGLDRV